MPALLPQITDVVAYVAALGVFALGALPLSRIVRNHPAYLHITGHSGAHFRQFDGLRGILALSVVLHHCLVIRRFAQGYPWEPPVRHLFAQLGPYAVTMFFFLTGFLFWTKLMRSERIEQKSYWKARILRLGPVYLLAMAALFLEVAILSGFRLHTGPVQLVKDAAGWLLFTIPASSPHDLNGVKNTRWLIAATPWSLRMEWCFYAVIPFLIWFARRPYRPLLLLPPAYYLAVKLQASWQAPVQLLHDFLLFLLTCFSVGIGAAYFRQKFAKIDALRSTPASLLMLGCMLFVLLRLYPAYGFKESIALAIPFLLIVCGNTCWGMLTARPMVFLGQISYSVYLLHGLVLSAAYLTVGKALHIERISAPAYWLYSVAVGLITICVSAVSYRFLEMPFIAGRKRGPAQPKGDAKLHPVAFDAHACAPGSAV